MDIRFIFLRVSYEIKWLYSNLTKTTNLIKMPMNEPPRHFYSLDVTRGLAALSVVFWHWQNFFWDGNESGKIDLASAPLYGLFFPFYDRGLLAVYYFFSISGFVFFWLYSERIRNRDISVWNFSVFRFLRLYPLH